MEDRSFIFEHFHFLYYKCHKKCESWWIIYRFSQLDKKSNNKSINKNDDKLALNHGEIGKDSGRTTKIKPFIDKYNWEGTIFPTKKDDWKIFENHNQKIALNVLYARAERNISCLRFKTYFKDSKTSCSFHFSR